MMEYIMNRKISVNKYTHIYTTCIFAIYLESMYNRFETL